MNSSLGGYILELRVEDGSLFVGECLKAYAGRAIEKKNNAETQRAPRWRGEERRARLE
jgi:hypothetical protein